jgi:branched-chain amino acid transport system permease protein
MGAARRVDGTILLFLLQDGITNGAIYALLGIGTVLIFAVTRVIFVPQGELVAFGALTFALLEDGRVPGTVWLTAAFGVAAFAADVIAALAAPNGAGRLGRSAAVNLLPPALLVGLTFAVAGRGLGAGVHLLVSLALVTPLGPYIYRLAFQPIAAAPILTLLIAAVGVHLALVGFGLVCFGAEGLRAPSLSDVSLDLGPLPVSGQSLFIYGFTVAAIAGLALFFERSLWGKALRATAVNRLGARLVGIRSARAGGLAFTLAALIAALSGVLIAPATTVYYDTGFIIGLKGFVAAIVGALASYPVTAVAAVGVGVVEAFASFLASDLKEVIVFLMIIPVLVWRSLTHPHLEEDEE